MPQPERTSVRSPRDEQGLASDEELHRFIAQHYGRQVVALQLICGSRALAEDAIQEALACAIERTQRGERINSLERWVAVASRNLARSWVRRLGAERRANERYGSRLPVQAIDGGSTASDRQALVSAVRALRPGQR